MGYNGDQKLLAPEVSAFFACCNSTEDKAYGGNSKFLELRPMAVAQNSSIFPWRALGGTVLGNHEEFFEHS